MSWSICSVLIVTSVWPPSNPTISSSRHSPILRKQVGVALPARQFGCGGHAEGLAFFFPVRQSPGAQEQKLGPSFLCKFEAGLGNRPGELIIVLYVTPLRRAPPNPPRRPPRRPPDSSRTSVLDRPRGISTRQPASSLSAQARPMPAARGAPLDLGVASSSLSLHAPATAINRMCAAVSLPSEPTTEARAAAACAASPPSVQ